MQPQEFARYQGDSGAEVSGILCRMNTAAQLCPSVGSAGHLTRVPWLLLLLISLGLFLLMLATLIQGKSGQGWERGLEWGDCFYFIYFVFALGKQELQHGIIAELLDFFPLE